MIDINKAVSYYKKLQADAFFLAKNTETANDLLQDLYLDILTKKLEFDGKYLLSYLRKRLLFIFLHYKNSKHNRTIPVDDIKPYISNNGYNMEAKIELAILRHRINHSNMPENCKEVLRLKLKGFSYSEIGKIIGKSKNFAMDLRTKGQRYLQVKIH